MEYLDLANQKAIRVNAMEEAKAYFDEAMGHLDTLPESDVNRQRRISLLVNQGDAFFLLIKMPEYYDLLTRYEPMASGLGNPELLGAFYVGLGRCEYSFGQFDQAIHTLSKAAELAEASGSVEEAGHAYAELEWSHFIRGDFDRVLALKENLLCTMEQRFNLRWYVRGLCAASRAYSHLGRWDEAVEEAQKALKVAEDSSDHSLIAFATWTLSEAHTWRGDLSRGIEYGELAVQKAQTPADKARSQRVLWMGLVQGRRDKQGN